MLNALKNLKSGSPGTEREEEFIQCSILKGLESARTV